MRPHRLTLAAAALGAALALPATPAHAQFGKILKKAAEKVAVDKAVDKATQRKPGDSTAATSGQTPANAGQGGAAAAAPAGGRAGTRRPAAPVSAASGTTEELIQKAISYDQTYVAARNSLFESDPRFASFKKARADYERCYARESYYEKATQRYQRNMELARLEDNSAAYKKWSDSLVVALKGKAKEVPAGCQIPELTSDQLQLVREEAAKSAEAKAGISEAALAGFRERSAGYLALSSPAERQRAVSSGAYSAADAAALDKYRDALARWMSHSDWSNAAIEPDPKAVAQYEAEMERYEAARATYDKCVGVATESTGSLGAPPAMTQEQVAQVQNMKQPTEAQTAEMQRLGKLAQAANNRGDHAKAKIYSDSAMRILSDLGVKPLASTPEQQKYARESAAAAQKQMAAQKKCGAPPEMPVKPAYMR